MAPTTPQEDSLFLSDPKAMQYVMNSGYNFPKSWEERAWFRLLTGKGLVSADGDQHARHRRVMNTSFSHSALKGFFPLFLDMSQRTVTMWKTLILNKNVNTPIIEVSSLLSHTVLDIIGEAAFGYKFGSIEGVEPQTELHRVYQNLLSDTNYMPNDFDIMFGRVLGYVPFWVSDLLIYLPKNDLQRLKNYMRTARNVAKDLIKKARNAHENGNESGRDVMSILIKANNSKDPKRRLEEGEILSQITTLMLAGHETTANSLGWMLYELSRHPEAQYKLREEINSVRVEVASRGDTEISISDLDSMEYLAAVIKETLRYHPIVTNLAKRAAHDDIIPLETPVHTVTGDTITAIPVRRGQVIALGLAAYNRIEGLWGEDSHQWRPERFLEGVTQTHQTNLGLIGNLPTFGSGLRACIGWRFALIEMQTILFDLLANFEFHPAPVVEIRRAINGVMQSMVKGEEHKGIQLPLTVSIVSNKE